MLELRASTREPLVPGHYTRTGFSPRIRFEVDGPWHAVQLFDGFFDIQQDIGSPDVIAVQFASRSWPRSRSGGNPAASLVASRGARSRVARRASRGEGRGFSRLVPGRAVRLT